MKPRCQKWMKFLRGIFITIILECLVPIVIDILKIMMAHQILDGFT